MNEKRVFSLEVLLVVLLSDYAKPEIIVDGVSMSTPLECYRPCEENEPPKICYYEFTLEYYTVLGRACEVCTPNNTNHFTADCQCVLTDGVERGMLTANRMIPGPSIQVCKNDKIVVDATNQIEGMEVTLHWHGVWQTGTPYSDGVPYVTQCPIQEATTFRYQFIAGNEGTHFWHSHSGLQKLDGLCGTLIIREPQSVDLSGDLYDYDIQEHVIIINDWMHMYAIERFPGKLSFELGQSPDSILINGKGQTLNPKTGCGTATPLEVFKVTNGKRYRFRLVNAFATVCPAELTIENHNLTVIASDGISMQPEIVGSIVSFTGERYDFVLEANESAGSFWIQVRGLGECGILKTQQLAILTYEKEASSPASTPPAYDNGLPQGRILNPLDIFSCVDGSNSGLCVDQLRSIQNVQGSVDQEPNLRINLFFDFETYTSSQLYVPGKYTTALVPPDSTPVNSMINGIHFQNPPSPLLSQIEDIDPSLICNDTNKPQTCTNSSSCFCTHVYDIPLNGLMEIILIDSIAVANLSHPFHLHGYVFEILYQGALPYNSTQKITTEIFQTIEDEGLIKRNYDHPPSKDTTAVPFNGYVVLRLRATNPGYWFFHCHFLYHIMVGMNLVIHVGTETDLPPVPSGFPTCGNFKPTINQNSTQV